MHANIQLNIRIHIFVYACHVPIKYKNTYLRVCMPYTIKYKNTYLRVCMPYTIKYKNTYLRVCMPYTIKI